MSSSAEQTLEIVAAAAEAGEEEEEAEQRVSDNENENENTSDQSQEWETMARAWLSSFPEPKAVSMDEVEAWIDSNFEIIPEGIKSMPRADVCQRLIAIQNCMRLPNQEEKEEKEEGQDGIPHYRFQRTDQWRPVYLWLETLDKDDVVKSKDIADWLAENPDIQKELCSRHSKYHMMHYVKKCHMKILKRRDKQKGIQRPESPAALKVHKDVVMKQPAPLPSPLSICNSLINVPKDSDLYLTKRKEALQKFEILVELEKLLAPTFLKQEDGKNEGKVF